MGYDTGHIKSTIKKKVKPFYLFSDYQLVCERHIQNPSVSHAQSSIPTLGERN